MCRAFGYDGQLGGGPNTLAAPNAKDRGDVSQSPVYVPPREDLPAGDVEPVAAVVYDAVVAGLDGEAAPSALPNRGRRRGRGHRGCHLTWQRARSVPRRPASIGTRWHFHCLEEGQATATGAIAWRPDGVGAGGCCPPSSAASDIGGTRMSPSADSASAPDGAAVTHP